MLDFKGKAKLDTWKKNKGMPLSLHPLFPFGWVSPFKTISPSLSSPYWRIGMPKEDAMRRYIDFVDELGQKYHKGNPHATNEVNKVVHDAIDAAFKGF